ncbi:MAG: phosphoglucomutase/phosphomannomutase family protein [Candidatus Bathyarchaeia archaeon]
MVKISFGTDGWRGVMNREFTFDNVKVVAQGIADYVQSHRLESRGIVVGYDTRKWSRQFAESVCEVMMGNNILTYVTKRDTPTPVTAFEVLQLKTAGAVMITASHNSPEWNGIKYIPEYAGPALPETTEEITCNVDRIFKENKIRELSITIGARRGLLKWIDPTQPYIGFVRKQLDLEAFRKTKLRVVFDAMYGTARGYLDHILRSLGCEVITIHNKVDPNFGGGRPEPLPEFLAELRDKVVSLNAELGLATDGDADRLAVYGGDGVYLAADQLLPLLFDHSIKSGRVSEGGVVRTVATTHLLDRIAKKYGLPVYEVPVGFKFVGQYLREKNVIIGGEESGGISFKGHIPDKDGIFTGVKVAEMLAESGKTLAEMLKELEKEYGLLFSGRIDVACSEELKHVTMEKISSSIPDMVAGIKVLNVNRIDGLKLTLEDEGWLLIRPSGTEPLFRIYGESPDKERLQKILEEGRKLVIKALSELV